MKKDQQRHMKKGLLIFLGIVIFIFLFITTCTILIFKDITWEEETKIGSLSGIIDGECVDDNIDLRYKPGFFVEGQRVLYTVENACRSGGIRILIEDEQEIENITHYKIIVSDPSIEETMYGWVYDDVVRIREE